MLLQREDMPGNDLQLLTKTVKLTKQCYNSEHLDFIWNVLFNICCSYITLNTMIRSEKLFFLDEEFKSPDDDWLSEACNPPHHHWSLWYPLRIGGLPVNNWWVRLKKKCTNSARAIKIPVFEHVGGKTLNLETTLYPPQEQFHTMYVYMSTCLCSVVHFTD